MSENFLAKKTLKYIWNHPCNRGHQSQAIARFFGWQIYKRLIRKSLDITLPSCVKLRCHLDSRSAGAALYCRLYDYDEMTFLLRFLQDGDSFLDVGSNIGIYTLLAASKTPLGHVYSIEALPKNVTRLKENISLNQFKNVTVYEIAVSDRKGYLSMDLADGDSTPSIANQMSSQELTVSTNTLSNLLPFQIKQLTLAKMDIEGAELLALQGATSLLQKQRPMVWILEVNSQIQRFGHSPQDLVSFLQSYNYEIYRYCADQNQIFPITLAEQKGNNLLAIATSSLSLVRDRLSSELTTPTS